MNVHVVFLYYIMVFYMGVAGISISGLLLLKAKDLFIRNYLIFFSIFGMKVLEIILMFYMFSNVNNNATALHIAYQICAIITFLFYVSMLWVVNESFDVPAKQTRHVVISAITLIFMLVGMKSYNIDISEQKFYLLPSFLAVNIYCVLAIIYVIYNGIKYFNNVADEKHRNTNKLIMKLFIFFGPLTFLDSLKMFGGTSISLGDNFTIIYFLPFVYCAFTLIFARHIEKEYLVKNNEKYIGIICEKEEEKDEVISEIPEKIIEKYKISNREREVLLNLLSGKSNQEIADIMEISINTVKAHLNNIYGKIGVRKRYDILSVMKNEIKLEFGE